MQKEQSRGKKKTPFVKEALPGEEQTYNTNRYFLGLCQFSAIFFICLHVFVYSSVYSFWAEGNTYVIVISAV